MGVTEKVLPLAANCYGTHVTSRITYFCSRHQHSCLDGRQAREVLTLERLPPYIPAQFSPVIMVFVNDKKYACESCIKGHRSSACGHTERPLFEVKKKGRPLSQCPKCRDLRQAKRVHSKCTCNPPSSMIEKVPIPAARPDRKPRRFMPSVPTLPNGIVDVLSSSDASGPSSSKQCVEALLNPCQCRSSGPCTCSSTTTSGPTVTENRFSSLAALADAAAMFSEGGNQQSPVQPAFPTRSCCSKTSSSRATTSQRLDLPPILSGSSGSLSRVPDFSFMPPLETIKSIAGSGCTCGLYCACPGCAEHRNPQQAMTELRNCKDGCGDCVDHSAVALPGVSPASPKGGMVDVFFDRLSALPELPKANGTSSTETDTGHPSKR
ncbi:copper fist DNA binding domain-containing protein [Pisolithus thermaeus]|nr:copper fist DNA binding domain-containing protein [Pisolithus thermaeus]